MKKLIIVILGIFLIGFVVAQTSSGPSVCCEKTNAGAWCVNTDEGNCNVNFKSSPTSCEETSYCRSGTCFDSVEGFCMENTPQVKCQEEENGAWTSGGVNEALQCQLGCCVIADQAAFVTLTRCKRLSNMFGVQTDYRNDISSELDCIATSQAQDMGACVFEQGGERSCFFTTRRDCNARDSIDSADGDITISGSKTFYVDLLCSAEELASVCSRQFTTGCYRGDVYWLDSCGNLENVYYAGSKENKEVSWNEGKVLDADLICSPGDNNCGNCDYLKGTRCGEEGFFGGASEGDFICKRTECKDEEGNERINGESWCEDVGGASGGGKDPVGKRYFRKLCIDGVVRTEQCADFRNEICIEGSIPIEDGEFGVAACRVNRWHDCNVQTRESDCTNPDRRDCIWKEAIAGMTSGVCVPEYPPGFDFWKENTESAEICNIGSVKCEMKCEEGLFDSEECEPSDCETEDWAVSANEICASIGDCGAFVNYMDKYTDDGFDWKLDGSDMGKFSQNNINKIKISGRVIGVDVVRGLR